MSLESFLAALQLFSTCPCLQCNHDILCHNHAENKAKASFVQCSCTNLVVLFFFLMYEHSHFAAEKKNLRSLYFDMQIFEIKTFQCSCQILTKNISSGYMYLEH